MHRIADRAACGDEEAGHRRGFAVPVPVPGLWGLRRDGANGRGGGDCVRLPGLPDDGAVGRWQPASQTTQRSVR